MMKLISITLLLGVLFSCSSFQAGNKVSTSDNMKSVSTIAFHNNVLFVGDSESASIHAYELKDSSFTSQKNVDIGRAQTFEGSILVKNINKKLADLMGSELADVKIRDMAVHKASQQVFLAVETAGSDNQPSIFKVNNGKIEHLNLSQYKHSSFKLNEKPKSSSKLEFGQKEKELTITDIDYHKGEIFVSGLGSGTFASKIRRIKYPFTGNSQTASVEIWHAVHAQFETRAPIISQNIINIKGKDYLVAVYACTPLVRIPLSKIKDNAKIRGEMIGELGFGNTPIDMINYYDPMMKSNFVLVTNTSRGATRFGVNDVASVKPMPVNTKNNFGPAGISQYTLPLTGAHHLDLINGSWAAVVMSDYENSVLTDLRTLPVPFFFDRADHIVEMNWKNGPDPFGYKKFKKRERAKK